MDLGTALKVVKKELVEAVQGKHFKDMCIERELDFNSLKELLVGKNIGGIRAQPEISPGRYLLSFKDQPDKDLNVAVQIINGKRLRFITIFPEKKGRRDTQ